MRYMLDTNICSFIIRQRPEQVILTLEEKQQQGASIVISSIAYAELLHGASKPKAPKSMMDDVDGFVENIDGILPFDAAATRMAARIQRELYLAGTPIGYNDSLIAGHAIATGCICVTNNTREFARVPGLRLEDWAVQQS